MGGLSLNGPLRASAAEDEGPTFSASQQLPPFIGPFDGYVEVGCRGSGISSVIDCTQCLAIFF